MNSVIRKSYSETPWRRSRENLYVGFRIKDKTCVMFSPTKYPLGNKYSGYSQDGNKNRTYHDRIGFMIVDYSRVLINRQGVAYWQQSDHGGSMDSFRIVNSNSFNRIIGINGFNRFVDRTHREWYSTWRISKRMDRSVIDSPFCSFNQFRITEEYYCCVNNGYKLISRTRFATSSRFNKNRAIHLIKQSSLRVNHKPNRRHSSFSSHEYHADFNTGFKVKCMYNSRTGKSIGYTVDWYKSWPFRITLSCS